MKASPVQLYREIGRRIREQRGKMTQDALARALELTRASISNIETGRQQIYVHTLFQIAAALKIDVTKLLPAANFVASDPLAIRLATEAIDATSRKHIMALVKSDD